MIMFLIFNYITCINITTIINITKYIIIYSIHTYTTCVIDSFLNIYHIAVSFVFLLIYKDETLDEELR